MFVVMGPNLWCKTPTCEKFELQTATCEVAVDLFWIAKNKTELVSVEQPSISNLRISLEQLCQILQVNFVLFLQQKLCVA